MRYLRKFKQPIHLSQTTNTLNISGFIHALVGWEVSRCSSSWLEDEDVALFTTKHQAIVLSHITLPMKTEKREKTA
jgi:hypothetical protein